MSYKTLQVRFEEPVCFVKLYRPESANAINDVMVEEFHKVLELYEETMTVLVLEGLPDNFCTGADFQGIHAQMASGRRDGQDPEPLYELWLRLAAGSFVTISHVRGKANAGGVGFVAASDIVIADHTAQFSLSELLFGLFPACVLPFLIRRIGFQKANYLTLMTQPISSRQALDWGLVDALDENSGTLLRKHLLRLKCLSKTGISRYKKYINKLDQSLSMYKPLAVAANKELFSDPDNLERIYRYIEKGQLPWEK
jgi:polyketide biosynthesis enoyl-CoA hydratase PksH